MIINTELKDRKTENIDDEYWLERFDNIHTRRSAQTSLRTFDYFCQNHTGLNGKAKNEIISRYQTWINQDKPDVRSICLSLDKFVYFMTQDHPEIVVNNIGTYRDTELTFKAKSPRTIKMYFGFIKTYLRQVHDVRLTTEDVKDYIKMPKIRKEPRRPISIETLKLILGKCDPERRALYYVLITSGMRLGEALSLKKSNLHLKENPVRITILADDTKTKQGRETFISSEALEKLKPILDKRSDDQYLFHDNPEVYNAVNEEDKYFMRLRERLGLTEKYPNSIRYVVNLHSYRSYFITLASQKHGSDYSHALSGHGAYLKEYFRLSDKEKANKYLALEPSLLIESIKTQADNTKDKIIDTLQSQMKKLELEMERIKKYPQVELLAQ